MPILSAGAQGFEPQLTDPESAVLPLDDAPMRTNCTLEAGLCQTLNEAAGPLLAQRPALMVQLAQDVTVVPEALEDCCG